MAKTWKLTWSFGGRFIASKWAEWVVFDKNRNEENISVVDSHWNTIFLGMILHMIKLFLDY